MEAFGGYAGLIVTVPVSVTMAHTKVSCPIRQDSVFVAPFAYHKHKLDSVFSDTIRMVAPGLLVTAEFLSSEFLSPSQ